MDEVRQIRVLIPPLFFVLSLLLAGHLDTSTRTSNAAADSIDRLRGLLTMPAVSGAETSGSNVAGIISTIAAGGAVVIAGGVAIGSVSNLVLRLFSGLAWLFLGRTWCTRWETFLPKKYFDNIWPKMNGGFEEKDKRRFYFYAAVSFDHKNIRDMQRASTGGWSAVGMVSTSRSILVLRCCSQCCVSICLECARPEPGGGRLSS